MKYVLYNKNLKNILNELGNEYKNLLIDNAIKNSSEIDPDNIDISKLIKKDIEIKDILRNTNKVFRLHRMTNILIYISLIYIMIGLILMLWVQAKDRIMLNNTLSIAYIIIIVGCIGAIFALTFREISRIVISKNEYKKASPYIILNKWKEIEGCLSEYKYPIDKKTSNMTALSMLKNEKKLSKEEFDNLRKLLILRNKVVHDDISNLNISTEETTEVLKEADKTLKKLYKIQYTQN